ncbi:MAG: hypothetical protein ACXIUZ_06720 [Lysobacteraceae bacterium]
MKPERGTRRICPDQLPLRLLVAVAWAGLGLLARVANPRPH